MLDGLGGPIRKDIPKLSTLDPTLDSCCQREEESKERQKALTTTLHRYDRIAMAERRRRHVLTNLPFGTGCRCCYDPDMDGGEYYALTELRRKNQLDFEEQQHQQNASGQRVQEEEDNHDSLRGMTRIHSHTASAQDYDEEEEEEDEYDYLLNEDEMFCGHASSEEEQSILKKLEDDRRAEIYLEALIRESAFNHGFGAHRQIHPQRIFQVVGLISSNKTLSIRVPSVVLHLYDPESPLSASLDLCLENISNQYKGTQFVRSNGQTAMMLNVDSLRNIFPSNVMKSSSHQYKNVLPCLVAIKNGAVVSTCPKLMGLGNIKMGAIDARAVIDWLDHSGVLDDNLSLSFEDICRIRPEEEALQDSLFREKLRLDENLKEENIYQCGVVGCKKTFRHEHIGVQNEQQSGLLLGKEEVLGVEK